MAVVQALLVMLLFIRGHTLTVGALSAWNEQLDSPDRMRG